MTERSQSCPDTDIPDDVLHAFANAYQFTGGSRVSGHGKLVITVPAHGLDWASIDLMPGLEAALRAARILAVAQRAPEPPHDHRVYFMCESCEEHNPEGAVGPRSDIAVMPDGTWLCDGCYSDCEKTAYGLTASDVDDFEFPRFEDLPRPAPYSLPSTQSAALTPDLMNGATVSCTGKEITIACHDHDTKDAIMDALTFIAKKA